MPRSTLPAIALQGRVVYPGVVTPLPVGSSRSKLAELIGKRDEHPRIALINPRPEQDGTALEHFYPTAVIAEVLQVNQQAGKLSTLVRGLQRARLVGLTQVSPHLMAEVEPLAELNADSPEAEGLAMSVRELVKRLIAASPEIPDEAALAVDTLREPARLADVSAAYLEISPDDKLALLAELDVTVRLTRVLEALTRRVQVLELKSKINTQVVEEMSRQQREVVLRKQMKAIQQELGDGDDESSAAADELAEKIAAAGMPDEVLKVAKKELSRLRGMPQASAEYNVSRSYLDWLVELPWSKRSEDRLDLPAARAQLEADHHGLDKVKKRILEYLAVRKLNPGKRGPILCLGGPPGVGKTSLGKSIAKALGRQLERISLGGVRDEAAIRGHRRTYVGAIPGRILTALRKAGTKNPVFVLDEIDKLGADFRGDPAAALLEVLDPEQNHAFSDHYLEVPFDLSEVIFIATANDLSQIPDALRDRLEVVVLPGYTQTEKRLIAERHLVPRQLSEHGLDPAAITFTPAAIDDVIEHYTREAGVRNLERELGSIVRGIAVKVASGDTVPASVDALDVPGYLGPGRFEHEVAERVNDPGVATGLAWTPTGGEILFIEITRMPGKGQLVITGQLGAVMKESAQAALSYVRSHALEWGIAPDVFERIDLHLHVPAGGVPKDGPSAGNAIVTALVSLLTGRRVRADVAMTGEISLRGNVLPVGGIQSKVLAAHRAGLKRVILPERNARDLAEVPAEVRAALDIVLSKKISETLTAALEPATVPVLLPVPTPGQAVTLHAA